MTLSEKPALADALHVPPRRELSFYFVLVLAVLPVWSAVPLSWAFVAYSLLYHNVWTYSWLGWCLFVTAFCEVLFSAYHYTLVASISGPSIIRPGSLLELRAVFHRMLQAGLASLPDEGYETDEETLDSDYPGSPDESVTMLQFDDPRAVDFRNYVRTWFGKAPWSSIRRHEMFSWLHWAVFNTPFAGIDKLEQVEQKILHEVIELLECRAGVKIPDGSNPAAKPFLLTLDPIAVSWRPLVWYTGVALSNAYIRRRFRSKWNAKVATYKDLEYILRIPPTWNPLTGPRPIVFMHGLGLGLTQYRQAIERILAELPNHPVLIPLLPHVSQEILHSRFLKPMGRDEMTECLAGLINELGWADLDRPIPESEDELASASGDVPKGITMLSHSNGSFSHAWMLKTHPSMITRSCFIDPVTFCSWEGDLCYNFVYRPCSDGLDLLIKYFVGSELGVANFLQRHFDWTSNSLWYEEIPHARDPKKAIFFLGGKDSIIDAHRVKRYLTSHGIRKGLRFDPNGRHGEAFLSDSPFHTEIMSWLKDTE